MGFTIADAIAQTQTLYPLTLLAGSNGCSNAMSWVHMIEDTTIIQQLWGKELAVTTGLGFQSHDALFNFVKCLIDNDCVGLIINVGKYIHEVSQDIIDYCDLHDFPLLTTPWKVYMADLIKDYCMRCLYSQREDDHVARLFQRVIIAPQMIEEVRDELMSSFDVDGYFQVVMIAVEGIAQFDAIERRRIAFQLELCFEKIECQYAFFWFDEYFVLIVNNFGDDNLKQIIEKMFFRTQQRMSNHSIYLGIGSQMQDLRQLILSYKRAKAAVKMAKQFKQSIVYFEDMGIYQILFSIEDHQILRDMYLKLLKPLIDYDQKHHSELETMLYSYLECDGSQVLMAKNLFMHRNTINYRMNKVKSLLNCDLDTFEEKMPYMIAMYLKKILAD